MILVKIAENIPSGFFVCFLIFIQDGNLQSDLSLATNQVSVCVCMRVTVQAQGRGRSGFATFTAARIRGGGQLAGSMAYIAAGHMG